MKKQNKSLNELFAYGNNEFAAIRTGSYFTFSGVNPINETLCLKKGKSIVNSQTVNFLILIEIYSLIS
jgi:hypothetical protein